eukprot:5301587-Pyramimonas_sp.AAC.1
MNETRERRRARARSNCGETENGQDGRHNQLPQQAARRISPVTCAVYIKLGREGGRALSS